MLWNTIVHSHLSNAKRLLDCTFGSADWLLGVRVSPVQLYLIKSHNLCRYLAAVSLPGFISEAAVLATV